MTTRERIDILIKKAGEQAEKETPVLTPTYWIGYINGLEELKLFIKPSERSITDEPS